MARLAKVVVPRVPHDVTQSGNRRQATFLNEGDQSSYLDLMAEWCGRCGVVVWAYCLMPNHVHLSSARKKGLTPDEIDEAAWMGISFAGSPAMVFYEQLKNS